MEWLLVLEAAAIAFVAGLWIGGRRLRIWRQKTPPSLAELPPVASFWIDGANLFYVDQNGTERYIQGTIAAPRDPPIVFRDARDTM